jgi:RNA polymerase sigma factor (sigma-70 family)
MNLYIVLGVGHGASPSEIKRAYRRLARRYHPDINPGDQAAEVRFRQILEAYETLMDPVRRSRYDAGQPPGDAPGRGSGGFEGFDFSARGVDYSATFGDLFADVIAARARRPASPQRGPDLHVELRVAFAEALAGGQRLVTVTRRDHCRACAGTGRTRAAASTCPPCHGTGAVRTVRGHMVFSRSCGACGGTGRLHPRACEGCGGAGQETRAETVSARVPPGVADGDLLRVPEKGSVGAEDGSFSAWLYRIAHNELMSYYRRQKFLSPLKWLGQTEGRGTETAVAQREQYSQLRQALHQLSAKDRDIIYLRYFEELASEEVAAILGCSTQNVYLRLHRALKRLQQQLEKTECQVDWRLESNLPNSQ